MANLEMDDLTGLVVLALTGASAVNLMALSEDENRLWNEAYRIGKCASIIAAGMQEGILDAQATPSKSLK